MSKRFGLMFLVAGLASYAAPLLIPFMLEIEWVRVQLTGYSFYQAVGASPTLVVSVVWNVYQSLGAAITAAFPLTVAGIAGLILGD